MKKLIVSSVCCFLLSFVFVAFAMAAGPQAGYKGKDEKIPIVTLNVSVPPCRSINVDIVSVDIGLELKSFKVDGKKVHGMSFSSRKEKGREVELKVRGIGLIELSTDSGFQWICLVVRGDTYPLPFPPPMPNLGGDPPPPPQDGIGGMGAPAKNPRDGGRQATTWGSVKKG